MSLETMLRRVINLLIPERTSAANAGIVPKFLRSEEILKPNQEFATASQTNWENEFKILTLNV